MPAIASHQLVELIFQRALDAPGDIKVSCASHGQAINNRQKLNNWRIKDRRDSVIVYPVGHPLHGASVYDCLSMRIPSADAADSHCIYVSKPKGATLVVEDVPGPEAPRSPLKIEEIPDLNIEGDDTK